MARSVLPSLLLVVALLPAALFSACGDGGEPESTPTSTATSTQTGSPTNTPALGPTPSVEEEVEAAYLAYWDAYSEAVLNLDPSLVEDFAAGEELESIRQEIEQLRTDGVALRVVVEHDLLVIPTSETAATVVDEAVNNSFFVDPVTKDPPEAEGSGEVIRYTFFLEPQEGRWVVVRGERASVE